MAQVFSDDEVMRSPTALSDAEVMTPAPPTPPAAPAPGIAQGIVPVGGWQWGELSQYMANQKHQALQDYLNKLTGPTQFALGDLARAIGYGLNTLVLGGPDMVADVLTKSHKALTQGLTPDEEVETAANIGLTTIGGGEEFRPPKAKTPSAFQEFHDQVTKPVAQQAVGIPAQADPSTVERPRQIVIPLDPRNAASQFPPPGVARSQLALTGDANVDTALNLPQVKTAIDNSLVDRTRDVPGQVSAQVDGPTVFVDRNLPRAVTVDGKVFDPADPLIVREQTTQQIASTLKAGGMAEKDAMPVARDFGQKAENAWYAAHGINKDNADTALAAARSAEDEYAAQAVRNVQASSRTAAGQGIDVSTTKPGIDRAEKKEALVGGLDKEQIAAQSLQNFEQTIRAVYRGSENVPTTGPAMEAVMDQIATSINRGLVKPEAINRVHETKYPNQTTADRLPAAKKQFAREFVRRLNDPTSDPIETAAWAEWRANIVDHFYSDGMGRISKVLSAIPLMRAGLPLPEARPMQAHTAFAGKTAPQNKFMTGASYLGPEWQRYNEFYHDLVNVPRTRANKAAFDLGLPPAEIAQLQEGLRRGITPAAIDDLPITQRVAGEADNLTSTHLQKGYLSQKYQDNRQFEFHNPDGSVDRVVGWSNGVSRLLQGSKAYAGPGGVVNGAHAVIVTGPGGVGKSSRIMNPLAERMHAAIADADDGKFVLPEYKGGIGSSAVHEESTDLMYGNDKIRVDNVLKRLTDEGANVIIGKIGHNPDSIRKLVDRLRKLDYKVDLVDVDEVRPEEVYRRRFQRFLETGRINTQGWKAMVDTFLNSKNAYPIYKKDKLFDEQAAYDVSGPQTRAVDGQETQIASLIGQRDGRYRDQEAIGQPGLGDRGIPSEGTPAGIPAAPGYAQAGKIIADALAKVEPEPVRAPPPNPIQQARELGVIGGERPPVAVESPAVAAQRAVPANPRQGDKIDKTPAGEPITAWEKRFNEWVERVKTPDDFKQFIRDAAAQNNNFAEARTGQVNPAHIELLADAAGIDPTKVDRPWFRQFFDSDTKVRMAKEAMDQALVKFEEARAKVEVEPTTENISEMLEAEMRRDLIIEQTLGLRAEWGRMGNALKDLLNAREAPATGMAEELRGKLPKFKPPKSLTNVIDLAREFSQSAATDKKFSLTKLMGAAQSLLEEVTPKEGEKPIELPADVQELVKQAHAVINLMCEA